MRIRDFFRLGVAAATGNCFPIPFPLTPDLSSAGVQTYPLAQNINYCLAYGYSTVSVASTIATLFASGGTLYPGVLNRTVTTSGNNDQFPTAAQVIAGLPNTLPRDGTLQFTSRYINNGTGQTITITTNTGLTLTGTMTIATNTWRDLLITININAGTYEITNIGAGTL